MPNGHPADDVIDLEAEKTVPVIIEQSDVIKPKEEDQKA